MRLKHSWAVESRQAHAGVSYIQPSIIFARTITKQSALNISDLGGKASA